MADDTYRKALREDAQQGHADKTSSQNLGAIQHRKLPLASDSIAKRHGILRTMRNEHDGRVFYESSFNPDTGTLIRVTEEATPKVWFREWYGRGNTRTHIKAWNQRHGGSSDYGFYSVRDRAYSPVPETIDVSINNWCNHGCEYCYTNATVDGSHAPVDLIRRIIGGLDQPPYQMAYGGGSPTQHPEFIKILEVTREMGSVPNYTTEGVNLTDKILAASNELCGGIAITFHAFRGVETFANRYERLRKGFGKQINIHLIADKDVATNMNALISLNKRLGKFNIVLLAYYPEVGRSTLDNIMPKPVYSEEFPTAIAAAMEAGNHIAFSEGLIPYFLSRPETGVDASMAIPTEGYFSCYVSMEGRMSYSSFNPPEGTVYDSKIRERVPAPNVFSSDTQTMWRELATPTYNRPRFGACGSCSQKYVCSIPNEHHFFICKFAPHNEPDSQPKKKSRGLYETSDYDDWGFF